MTQGLLFGGDVEVDYAPEMYPARRVMLDSGSEHWCSSDEVLDPVRKFDRIGFDPFSNPHSIVGADRAIMMPEDSLLIDWPLGVLIYCNPPYGAALRACAKKIAQQAARGCEIITLVPCRVDTEWWQSLLGPRVWCAWTGRLHFWETMESFESRYAEKCQIAAEQRRRPPKKPSFRIVQGGLVESDPAAFPSAVCYAGHRKERFVELFDEHGSIYERLARAA